MQMSFFLSTVGQGTSGLVFCQGSTLVRSYVYCIHYGVNVGVHVCFSRNARLWKLPL